MYYAGTTEKRPVVIDIGSHSWRCGIAGEGQPRCIVRTPPSIQRLLGHNVGNVEEDLTQMSRNEAEEIMAAMVRYILYEQLLVKPKEHRVVLCAPHDSPHFFKDVLISVLFQFFHSPSIYYNSSSVFALHAVGRTSGLIVDVGHKETRVVPMCHGVAINHAVAVAPVGAKSLERYLRKRVEVSWFASGRSAEELEMHMENVVRSACVVAARRGSGDSGRGREGGEEGTEKGTKAGVGDGSVAVVVEASSRLV